MKLSYGVVIAALIRLRLPALRNLFLGFLQTGVKIAAFLHIFVSIWFVVPFRIQINQFNPVLQ